MLHFTLEITFAIKKNTYPFSIIRCFAEFSNAESGETSQSITRNLSKQILSVNENNIKIIILVHERKTYGKRRVKIYFLNQRRS